MKPTLRHLFCVLLILLWSLPARPLGITPKMSYSARLQNNQSGQALNGSYDVCFTLYETGSGGAPASPTMVSPGVQVSNGLFRTEIDFGSNTFNGTAYWLEVGVRTNDTNTSFTILSPRQELTATPYASYAPAAGTASVATSTSSNSVTGASIREASITEEKLATGAVVKTLNGLRDHVTLTAGPNIALSVGSGNVQISASSLGGVSGMAEFTTVGSNSFTVPAGITRVLVEVWGGGGGGGASGGFPTQNGSGGGAGGYSRSVLNVTPGATYSVFIGAGGNGGDPAQNGGSSSLRDLGGTTLLLSNGGTGGSRGGSGSPGGTGDPNAMVTRTGAPGAASAAGGGAGGPATIGSIQPIGAGGGRGSVPERGGNGYVLITW